MKQRTLPSIGGGPPVLTASARFVNPAKKSPPTPLTLTLNLSADAEQAGLEVVQLVRASCDVDDFDTLSALVMMFPSVTSRVAEFHALMDELVQGKKESTLRKIFRVPGNKGPVRGDEFYFVALIEHVLKEQPQLKHATQAIEWLATNLERGPDVRFVPSCKTMQNAHARLKDLFRLWSASLFVRGELLTASPWMPPGYVPEPQHLVATKLSNAIIFHSPDDTVTEPEPKE